MRKTKIVCTLGPATDRDGVLRKMLMAGMNVARFNFSHGSHEEHLGRLKSLRALREELDLPVAAMLDTRGPEIRLKTFAGGSVQLRTGQTFTLTTQDIVGDETTCAITYSDLPQDVKTGDTILLDDGLVRLTVQETTATAIRCVVENDGVMKDRKGVNVPNVRLSMPYMSQRDREDILFGVEQGFDYIAASFVRTAADVRELRQLLDSCNSNIRIIAKIENQEGVSNLPDILAAADGVMVARGDMGVEIPAEKVPYIQKMIIRKCNEQCKSVITATQMLDSMIRNPRPTRAEVTDVANAVYDGTDAVMLSGETAMGKYPVEALKMMATIVEDSESHLDYEAYRRRKVSKTNTQNISNAVCFASVSTAHDLGAQAIIAPSITGFTTLMLSKWRPSAQIIGMSPSMATVRQMQIQWGVVPVWSRRADSTDELIENSMEELKNRKMLELGDLVVITAGVVTYARRHEAATQTNIMRVLNVE